MISSMERYQNDNQTTQANRRQSDLDSSIYSYISNIRNHCTVHIRSRMRNNGSVITRDEQEQGAESIPSTRDKEAKG